MKCQKPAIMHVLCARCSPTTFSLSHTHQCKGHKTFSQEFRQILRSASAVAGYSWIYDAAFITRSLCTLALFEKFHVKRRSFIVMINNRAFFVRNMAFLWSERG